MPYTIQYHPCDSHCVGAAFATRRLAVIGAIVHAIQIAHAAKNLRVCICLACAHVWSCVLLSVFCCHFPIFLFSLLFSLVLSPPLCFCVLFNFRNSDSGVYSQFARSPHHFLRFYESYFCSGASKRYVVRAVCSRRALRLCIYRNSSSEIHIFYYDFLRARTPRLWFISFAVAHAFSSCFETFISMCSLRLLRLRDTMHHSHLAPSQRRNLWTLDISKYNNTRMEQATHALVYTFAHSQHANGSK